MLVRFNDNLGKRDAGPLGLDIAKCTKGSQLEVSDAVGERLIKKLLAIAVDEPKAQEAPSPKPPEAPKQEIKAVPPQPTLKTHKQSEKDKE